MSWKVKSI